MANGTGYDDPNRDDSRRDHSEDNDPAGDRRTPDERRRRVGRTTFIVILLLAFGLFALVAGRFVLPAFLAALTVGLFRPMHRFFLKVRATPRWLAAGVATLAVILVFLIPAAGVVYLAVDAVAEVAPDIAEQAAVLEERVGTAGDFLRGIPVIGEGIELLIGGDGLAGSLRVFSRSVASEAGDLITATPELALMIFIYVYCLFFFFRDGESMSQSIIAIFPLRRDLKERLRAKTIAVTRAILKGTLLVGAVQGAMVGVTMSLAGLSGGILWGSLIVFFAIIPGLGPVLVWLPGVVVLFSSGRIVGGIILAAVGAGPVAVVDNILRPKLIGDDIKIHQLLILVGVIGGIAVFGVFGFIIGPIVMAVFVQLLEVYRDEFSDEIAEAGGSERR